MSSYVDARDLLEHLVDVSQNCPMQVTLAVELEAIGEAAASHFEDGILDGFKLILDLRVVLRQIGESCQDLQSASFSTFQDEPARRLG